MAEELALFEILLSAERSTPERLNALQQLEPFLKTDEAVTKLSDALRTEETIAVKRQMLALLCAIDITRISDRDSYIKAFAFTACLDPERSLRYIAVQQLAALAPHINDVQEILAEVLMNDLDTDIQQLSIQGLYHCVQKTAGTIERIKAHIPVAPQPIRPGLLALVKQLQQPGAEELSVQFLDRHEDAGLRMEALHFISGMPSLTTATLTTLAGLLPAETDLSVRSAILQLFTGMRRVEPAVFRELFTALQRMPDLPELLQLVAGRLTAEPELANDFISLFQQTSSAGLKIRLLFLLQHHDRPDIVIAALQDANPYVREASLPLITRLFPQHQDQLEPALAAVLRTEPLLALRRAMVNVLLQTGRKSAGTENMLIELALAETDHQLKIQLAEAVSQLAVTDDNRQPLLQLFSEIIEGVWYPETLKQQVTARLHTFAYRDEPALKKSLSLLLEQAKNITEVNRVYQLLKTLEADFSQLAPYLFQTLYRHIAWYPQQPLHEWVQMLGKMADNNAAIRAELPYMISVTGATWLLAGTEKADQTGAFLPAFRQTMMRRNGMQTIMEAQRLLTDAWNNRTIKKAEVTELYTMLLRTPKSDGFLQQLTDIMKTGKLVTPELVALSLDYIQVASDRDGVYMVRKYLEQAGFNDLAYREKLVALFTQEQYSKYMQFNAPQLHTKKRYTTLNDWEYSAWCCPYSQWPIAELVFTIEPGDLALNIFRELPDTPDTAATLPYLVLEHLFRNPVGSRPPSGTWANYLYQDADRFAQFLQLLYNGYRSLPDGDLLRDRMLYTFWKKWNDYVQLLNGRPVSPELADAAGYVYAGVCALAHQLDPDFKTKQFPTVLKNMNSNIVQQNWPWSTEQWEQFEYKYFPKRDPQQEAAEQLFQEAANALKADNLQEGLRVLKELLQHYPQTRLVKDRLNDINAAIAHIEQKLADG